MVSLFWCVLATALILPTPAHGRIDLGVVQEQVAAMGGPEALERFGAELAEDLKEEVVIRVFQQESKLFDWMHRFRVVELGLAATGSARRQPAGRFHEMGDWPEHAAVFLTHQGTSAQRRALLKSSMSRLIAGPGRGETSSQILAPTSAPIPVPTSPSTFEPPAATTPESAPAEPSPEHLRAVELAREGRFEESLRILSDLYSVAPQNRRLSYDYLTVLGWAELDAEVVALAESLSLEQAPLYVVEAVGKSLRNQRRFSSAAELYAQAVERFPEHFPLHAGLAYALAEAGDTQRASAQAERLRRLYPGEVRTLEVELYVAEAGGEHLAALDLSEEILALHPAHEGALRARIEALRALGASHLAHEKARRDAEVVTPAVWRRLQADRAAHEVRWGGLEPPTEDQRFAQTDQALARIEENLAALDPADPAARPFIVQARVDRIVALRDRVRMRAAADEYESLAAAGAAIPGYALQAAADAYLYLQEPERARDLYLEAFEQNPGDFKARLGLFYAYVELENFPRAYALADALQAEQSAWTRRGGRPQANPQRLDADITAALARVFGDDLREGQERFEKMHAAAPRNPDLVRELGNVYDARGWPRLAQQAHADGLRIAPDHLGLQIGHAATRLDLREFDQAEAEIADLYRRYPENSHVQRLHRLWEIHRLRELRVEAAYTDSSGAEPSSRELRLGSTLFSRPFLTHYRAFVGGFWSRGSFPEGRGTYQRYSGGLEYRGRDIEGSLSLSANHSDGTDLGAAVAGTWYRDDHWSVPFALELFSSDAPLRALSNGVDADSARLGVDYRHSELRRLGLGGQFMDFSDGNQRGILSGYVRQRLITRPHYKLGGVLDLGTSFNSRSDVPYFSPENDFSAELTLDNNWLLYRRYSRTFGHRLAISGGTYWQKGFGAEPVAAILYEHNWQAHYRFRLTYGAVLSRRAYDGEAETGTEYYLRLGWRL